MKISIIGYGNMGQAIAARLLLDERLFLQVSSPSLENKTLNLRIKPYKNNILACQGAKIIILAVKPKQVQQVLGEIASHLPKKSILLSVVSGVRLQQLKNLCSLEQAIIRCMPNTPVAIGEGILSFFAEEKVYQQYQPLIEKTFKPLGSLFWLEQEALLDPITALSGSGPAYVYLFMESLIKGAISLGIEEDTAKIVTQSMVKGALSLALASPKSLSELREQITSPQGTTACALQQLQQGHFSELIAKALQAACNRATELGNEY